MKTTKISADPELGGVMTGRERYPIIGDRVTYRQAEEALTVFGSEGLPLMGGCILKNLLAWKSIGNENFELATGSICVLSRNRRSAWGHAFNPPLEAHFWLQDQAGAVIDLALPGVILRGLKERDAYGPALTGRKPVILAGNPPDWIRYQCYMVIPKWDGQAEPGGVP